MEKQHKHKVGDTLTVKIAAVEEVKGITVYRLRGIERICISKKELDNMRQDRFIPGEMAYTVCLSGEEKAVILEAFVVEDVSTKEIKLGGDWFDISKDEMFKDQQMAESHAVKLAVKYGCKLVKNSYFVQEEANGNE